MKDTQLEIRVCKGYLLLKDTYLDIKLPKKLGIERHLTRDIIAKETCLWK